MLLVMFWRLVVNMSSKKNWQRYFGKLNLHPPPGVEVAMHTLGIWAHVLLGPRKKQMAPA